MKINMFVFSFLSSCVFLSGLSFADEPGNYDEATAMKYEEAAENLQNEMNGYANDPLSADQFYADQEQKLNEAAAQLEVAHQAGQMTDADYEEAKKSLAETREFIITEGKNLGPQMAALNQAAAPIMAAHTACQDLENDPQNYQVCVQSKLQ